MHIWGVGSWSWRQKPTAPSFLLLWPGLSLQLLRAGACGACTLTLTLSGDLEEPGNSGSMEIGPTLRPFRASTVQ